MINHTELMQGLTVQHLQFRVRPTESILFPNQPGSALRGALYRVLSDNFCSEPLPERQLSDHAERCPVCWMLAAENRQDVRGLNIPRPLTVEPPAQTTYHRGDDFVFGFSLIGQAQNLLPYLVRAVQRMGEVGIGKGRGRFKLLGIDETNPLLDVTRILLENQTVKRPTLQVNSALIDQTISELPPDFVTLELISPVRLTAQKQLVKTPDPTVFMQRLIERCQRLAEYYGEPASKNHDWRHVSEELTQHAENLSIGVDYTLWQEEWSGSQRQNRYLPLSGLVGTVRWDGDVAPLLPWLLWGQSLHVGKNAVKGNGWYRVLH